MSLFRLLQEPHTGDFSFHFQLLRDYNIYVLMNFRAQKVSSKFSSVPGTICINKRYKSNKVVFFPVDFRCLMVCIQIHVRCVKILLAALDRKWCSRGKSYNRWQDTTIDSILYRFVSLDADQIQVQHSQDKNSQKIQALFTNLLEKSHTFCSFMKRISNFSQTQIDFNPIMFSSYRL